MTLRVDRGVWETKERMKVNEYRACAPWAVQFD